MLLTPFPEIMNDAAPNHSTHTTVSSCDSIRCGPRVPWGELGHPDKPNFLPVYPRPSPSMCPRLTFLPMRFIVSLEPAVPLLELRSVQIKTSWQGRHMDRLHVSSEVAACYASHAGFETTWCSLRLSVLWIWKFVTSWKRSASASRASSSCSNCPRSRLFFRTKVSSRVTEESRMMETSPVADLVQVVTRVFGHRFS